MKILYIAHYKESSGWSVAAKEHILALDNAGIDTFSGWSEDPDGCQRIGESAFVIPLIKAVQELSEKVSKLENKE